MDGLRKVPDNVPNKEMLGGHLGKPLTAVPDPFGTHPSFGAHNNARLRAFLDSFGFDYEFLSSTDCYTSGPLRRDAAAAARSSSTTVMAVMLPTLGPERRATYSPFLPISPDDRQRAAGADRVARRRSRHDQVSRTRARRSRRRSPAGAVKLQWKPDWAMRWVALGVDYEMAGKDLIDSGQTVRRRSAERSAAAARRLQLRAVPRR